MTQNTVKETSFSLSQTESLYRGKVRDVYFLKNNLLVMVASDRISAFDVILPEAIPYKGQVLSKIATRFMELTADIVPNWIIGCPHQSVTVGKRCTPFKVEMVIRGYLSGHAWREYRDGKRSLCGVPLPEGLKENDRLPSPIITPTTKEDIGAHDEDISREDIIKNGLVSEEDYTMLEKYTYALFQRGQEIAASRGLILVDTKYEFGKDENDVITLIDEIHTPDSSRYFYAEGYEQRQEKGEAQKQLSKEFVREWLMDNGFQGKEGQTVPEMTPEVVNGISERYIELYEHIMGEKFTGESTEGIEEKVVSFIEKL